VSRSKELVALLALTCVALVGSGVAPHDRLTWTLEVFPVILGIAILTATYSELPLSPLVYRLLFVHAVILIVGGHYTYARVPIGFWVQDLLDLSRNHYDRLGHLVQGFVPAILAREILLRRSPLRTGKWLFFLVVCVCLAFSALYELLEWWAAILGGESARSFLGTQGDEWDTQWDMFLALLGAILAHLVLRRAHDRSIAALGPEGDRLSPAGPGLAG